MKNTKRVLAFLVGAAMMLPMASAEGTLASGDYEATSQGFGGAVTVKVTVTDGKVTAAELDACSTCDLHAVVNNGLSQASQEQLKHRTGEEIVDADLQEQQKKP